MIFETEKRLLLLSAHARFTDDMLQSAKILGPQVGDWNFVLRNAWTNYSLPFLLELAEKADIKIPEKQRSSALALNRLAIAKTLSAQSELVGYVDSCLLPNGFPYRCFKGIALSHQVYPKPHNRSCRDIDIVVPSKAFRDVLATARREGYSLFVSPDREYELKSLQDIDAAAKYLSEVILYTKNAAPIELHKSIDKGVGVFAESDVFSSSDSVSVGGTKISTLPIELHACYVCYHGASHAWGRLHWLVDLDAFLTLNSFSKFDTLQYARRLGIDRLFETCVDLQKITSDIETDFRCQERPAQFFRRVCVATIPASLERERQIRGRFVLRAFRAYRLLSVTKEVKISTKRLLRRGRPHFGYYMNHPRPPRHFWIYGVEHFLSSLKALFRRAFF